MDWEEPDGLTGRGGSIIQATGPLRGGIEGAQAIAAVGAGDQEAVAISGVPWTEQCQGMDRRWGCRMSQKQSPQKRGGLEI